MNTTKHSYLISRFVILSSLCVAVILGIMVWDINYWPTDAEVYYMPAALRIPNVHFLSQIHVTEGLENVRWLHGKEIYVATISLFQFLMNDFVSLRPLMLMGLIANALASIFIFYIGRRLWGEWIALFGYLAFTLCLWPYIYILFAKHQPLGLMFFLLSLVFLLNLPQRTGRPIWFLFSGLSLGLAFFSSTVTSLYTPYYAAFFFLILNSLKSNHLAEYLKNFLGASFLVITGFFSIFIYVNLPDIFLNIRNFADYVHISGAFNHFYYNQPALQQFFPHQNVGEVRGGWLWILKYLILILPVLFWVYVLSVTYLGYRIVTVKNWPEKLKSGGIIFLSLTPLALAEIARVAQYGANYFPALLGILCVICFAIKDFCSRINLKKSPAIKPLIYSLTVILAAHAVVNLTVFIEDVYKPRMANKFLSDKILALGADRMATYRAHYHRNPFVACLSPKVKEKVRWIALKSMDQLSEGYVLVPPPSGDSIYTASSHPYINYDKDWVLVQLIKRDLLKACSVASFRTLINSTIWQQEEEILSARRLILNQNFPEDNLGRVWILDAAKVNRVMAKFQISREDGLLAAGKIKNIGTADKFYIFEGQRLILSHPSQMRVLLTQIWKKGDPSDGLVAYIYKSAPNDPIWLPMGKSFYSAELPAANIRPGGQDNITPFYFDPPVDFERGVYYAVIYRTGPADDGNYYQIDSRRFAVR